MPYQSDRSGSYFRKQNTNWRSRNWKNIKNVQNICRSKLTCSVSSHITFLLIYLAGLIGFSTTWCPLLENYSSQRHVCARTPACGTRYRLSKDAVKGHSKLISFPCSVCLTRPVSWFLRFCPCLVSIVCGSFAPLPVLRPCGLPAGSVHLLYLLVKDSILHMHLLQPLVHDNVQNH